MKDRRQYLITECPVQPEHHTKVIREEGYSCCPKVRVLCFECRKFFTVSLETILFDDFEVDE